MLRWINWQIRWQSYLKQLLSYLLHESLPVRQPLPTRHFHLCPLQRPPVRGQATARATTTTGWLASFLLVLSLHFSCALHFVVPGLLWIVLREPGKLDTGLDSALKGVWTSQGRQHLWPSRTRATWFYEQKVSRPHCCALKPLTTDRLSRTSRVQLFPTASLQPQKARCIAWQQEYLTPPLSINGDLSRRCHCDLEGWNGRALRAFLAGSSRWSRCCMFCDLPKSRWLTSWASYGDLCKFRIGAGLRCRREFRARTISRDGCSGCSRRWLWSSSANRHRARCQGFSSFRRWITPQS